MPTYLGSLKVVFSEDSITGGAAMAIFGGRTVTGVNRMPVSVASASALTKSWIQLAVLDSMTGECPR